MTIVVLTSASGAPGVTTTALGLALVWPRDVLLIDADRSAPQAISAGFLGGVVPGPGLQEVWQAHRESRSIADAVERACRPFEQPPGDESGIARRFLPGFQHLGTVDLFDLAWGSVVDALREADYDVIIDAGRTTHRGLPRALVAASDAVWLVGRSSLASLVALRPHVPALLDGAEAGRVGLALVGPGRPYATKEVADQFGVPVAAEIAWDPSAAAELMTSQPVGRRWGRSSLARSLREASVSLAAAPGAIA